jgi:hypothetical protein
VVLPSLKHPENFGGAPISETKLNDIICFYHFSVSCVKKVRVGRELVLDNVRYKFLLWQRICNNLKCTKRHACTNRLKKKLLLRIWYINVLLDTANPSLDLLFWKLLFFGGYIYHILAMFGWYRLVLVVVVVFSTSKLTHKKLTPWMFGWRC